MHQPDQETASQCQRAFPDVHVFLFDQGLTAGEIRNQLIAHTHPDYFLFIDDDTIIPKNYFLKAKPLLETRSTVIGGPDLCPTESTFFQKSFSIAQQSLMISAHTRYRHGSPTDHFKRIPTEHDFILCNLWLNARVFKEFNLKFPTGFKRNEENILLGDISMRSQSFIFHSDLFLYHEKKNNFITLTQAVFGSGYFRMKSIIKYPSSLSPLFLAPLFFILYLMFFIANTSMFGFFPLIVFLILIIFFSAKLTILQGKSLQTFLAVSCFHLVIILIYGLGTIAGLKELFFEKSSHHFS